MKKQEIVIPKGIRYLSEIKDLKLPNHPCIIDKKLTGCGFTQFCITNEEDLVLCSPRKMLLENKEQQNTHVLYVKNEFDYSLNVDKDLTQKINRTKVDNLPKMTIEYYTQLKINITDYISKCRLKGIPVKILVTYDSFKIVKEVLRELGSDKLFRVVVDEFQSIFTDSRFKSGTEMEFLYHLQGLDKVNFVSATPMIEKYLDQLDEFKYLPYYEMNWIREDSSRLIKPDLLVRSFRGKSLMMIANEIIQEYINGNFEKALVPDSSGNLVEKSSEEVVFYVNSVKNITDTIRKSKLLPDQVNILCANTDDNVKKLHKSLGRKYNIGHIPLKGEPRKMFTFCTRTVYLGADFYSDNAKTVILSDANIECLAVDITLDLPQILGRQRDESNPWKNRATLFAKLLRVGDKVEQEMFAEFVKKKTKVTNNLLESYELGNRADMRFDVATKYLKDAKNSNYKDDYVAVNAHTVSTLDPVFNNLVMLSEIRAFEVQQVDYADRFSVYSAISKSLATNSSIKVQKFLDEFDDLTRFPDKMKLLCEVEFSESELDLVFKQIPLDYGKYYNYFGPKFILEKKCMKYTLDDVYSKRTYDRIGELDELVYLEFSEGDRVSLVEIKLKLSTIYTKVDCPDYPHASELMKYFEIKDIYLTLPGGKRGRGYKLIKRLR